MQKTLLLLALLTSGCVMRPNIVASPAVKAEALSLYMKGATSADLSAYYQIAPDEARHLIRLSIRELHKKFDQDR